ncbi:hypothetical protein [Methylobacterium sp. NEAU K]|uniref:hypothetical protein n=1 Tax=Methylobacterium sp. NEAU K TaxID=3064946 RepID=UPI002733533B|nr:hypothetical protein [Methylobacterium sp. NEAU K]MDP4006884.1 hypothetical protein [Methylobacterium sp. NEAU K]
MSFRASLKNLIRRDAERPSLRERAADLQADLSRVVRQPVAPEPTPDFASQVAQAAPDHDVLASSGIDHRDGTVSYCDATGKVSRRPMAHWICFNAQQMHSRVQGEMGRRRVLEANHLSAGEHTDWEARIRRELRSDAVHALAFRHDRAFKVAQALRNGTEPATPALRAQGDAELLALAPLWEAAVDLYQQRTDEENAIDAAASEDGGPGAAPEGSGPEWQAWFQQKEDWRERTGMAAAEEAVREAGTALYRVETQIAELPAASLAGLKLKARVAQRSDDIGVDWPDGLGPGLARDILTFTEAEASPPKPVTCIADRIDFASATLKELQAIHDTAQLVGDVAQAAVWQGRCQAPAAQKRLGVDYNAAGDLMAWLSDELTNVEHLAIKQVKKRQPDDRWDRGSRLAWIAPSIIQNEDTAETAAFIGELATFLADEAKG